MVLQFTGNLQKSSTHTESESRITLHVYIAFSVAAVSVGLAWLLLDRITPDSRTSSWESVARSWRGFGTLAMPGARDRVAIAWRWGGGHQKPISFYEPIR